MNNETIETDLFDLTRRLDEIADVPEPPLTTLQAIGRAQRERYWQRLVLYFLTPTEPHGLDDEFLDHFLEALGDLPDVGLSHSIQDLESVEISIEVPANGRPVDLLLWAEGEWFICVEMKIASPENDEQTLAYAASDSFDGGSLNKENIPDEGHNYLYLAPEDAVPPESEQFVKTSWKWLETEVRTFLDEGHGRHPRRTEAQLDDFADTITSELTMTDHKESQFSKASLAIDYADSIKEVQDALESYQNSIQNGWPDWFLSEEPENWELGWHPNEDDNGVHLRTYREEWRSYGQDLENEPVAAYVEFVTNDENLSKGLVVFKITVKNNDANATQKVIDSFEDDSHQAIVTDTIDLLNTDPSKNIELPTPKTSNEYPAILKAKYQFDPSEKGYEVTATEVFEDLDPVFGVVMDCLEQYYDST